MARGAWAKALPVLAKPQINNAVIVTEISQRYMVWLLEEIPGRFNAEPPKIRTFQLHVAHGRL